MLVTAVAEMLVPEEADMPVLMAVGAGVHVAVHRLAHVTVLVRHFAAVLVVVHHLAGMDQRYALAGQPVRVHVIDVLRRHVLGHHDDDPMVSA